MPLLLASSAAAPGGEAAVKDPLPLDLLPTLLSAYKALLRTGEALLKDESPLRGISALRLLPDRP